MTQNNSANDAARCEAIDLRDLATKYGTPLYVYSRAAIESRWRAFDDALAAREHLVCYAVKAASNIAILNLIARLGGGFDIVSGGELARVLAAGGDAERVVFSGVGKRSDEIEFALETGIRCFNVESAAELREIEMLAAAVGKVAPVALRVNPDISASTHEHTATGHKESKFGLPADEAMACAIQADQSESLDFMGLSVHVGSQITQLEPLVGGVKHIVGLANDLAAQGIRVRSLNCGGGLGIKYGDEATPELAEYGRAILDALNEGDSGENDDRHVLIEPGRSIVGAAGTLLTEVLYVKKTADRHLAIVDAGMNDLLRPALYGARHIVASLGGGAPSEPQVYDIAGPVCESGDYLARAQTLSAARGDILAVRDVGAYGFSMASVYNSRPRPAEVLVDGERAHLIRARESRDDLFAGERLIP